MNVKELYDYKLKKYKENGIRENLDRLLLLLMLNEKDKYEPFTCCSGEFYERYKEEINKNIAKIESDFDVTRELLEELIEEKGILIDDFECDKIWFVYPEGFGGLQWGIIYQKDKTPEELYVLNFEEDEDIRLLNCLNEEFNYLDFITLFTANLKLRDEELLRYNELKEDLLKYYYDDKYNCLFGNFKLVKENDKEIFDIDMMLELAKIRNLINVYDRVKDYSVKINLKEEDCVEIINKYEEKFQDLMSDLTDNYLFNLYENKCKKYVKK